MDMFDDKCIQYIFCIANQARENGAVRADWKVAQGRGDKNQAECKSTEGRQSTWRKDECWTRARSRKTPCIGPLTGLLFPVAHKAQSLLNDYTTT